MSAAARWSYTATATLWPWLGRDDWSGVEQFGPPEALLCDYRSEARRLVDATGVEFTAQLSLFTERADIKQGDRVLIGASTALDPIAAGALEVRTVKRDADTFDRVADDFEIVT